MFVLARQSGQLLGEPSGVREETVNFDPYPRNLAFVLGWPQGAENNRSNDAKQR